MMLAISFILILILAALIIMIENRIVTLTKRVRVLEALCHYHEPHEPIESYDWI